MTVVACEVPFESRIEREMIDAAWFRDAWQVALAQSDISVIDAYFAIFGHRPAWMQRIMIARNRIAAQVGLETPTDAEIRNAPRRDQYAVGDKIGAWPIFALSETELVAGRNNGHLDFRLSILRGGASRLTVSTVCTVHNVFGKLYLAVIIPFHKWGLRRLIADAVTGGRL